MFVVINEQGISKMINLNMVKDIELSGNTATINFIDNTHIDVSLKTYNGLVKVLNAKLI